MEKKNLPVKVEKKYLVEDIKNKAKKGAKILGSTLGLAGCSIATAISAGFAPILIAPALIGGAFCAQKLLNNTVNKTFKDLAFITAKHGKSIKIFQDATRFDITSKMRGFSNIEKAAFMQMQTIIGVSKFPSHDKYGNEIVYETDTHGINQKTFRKLQELGYIKDYEESFKKNTRLILPKVAFGNFKELNKMVKIYNIKFSLTGKAVDLEDENLRRYFPMVFGTKKGIIASKGYNFTREEDSSLTIEYKPEQPYIKEKNKRRTREGILKRVRKGAPSLEEQKIYIQEIQKGQQKDKQEITKEIVK